MEKRFAMFTGRGYYPDGGWNDFKGVFATVDEAVQAGLRHWTRDTGNEEAEFFISPDKIWIQIVDLTTLKEVKSLESSEIEARVS